MSTGTWNTLRNWCRMSPSARSRNRAKLAATGTATQSVNDLPAACTDSVGFVPWWRRLHLVAADASTLSLGFCASTVTNPTSADQLAFGLASARRRNEAGRLAAQHPPERALDALRASRPYRSRRTAAHGPRISVPLGACRTEQARRRFLHACRAHRQRRFRLRAPCPRRVARALEQVTGRGGAHLLVWMQTVQCGQLLLSDIGRSDHASNVSKHRGFVVEERDANERSAREIWFKFVGLHSLRSG